MMNLRKKNYKTDWDMIDVDLKSLLLYILRVDSVEWSVCFLVGKVPQIGMLQVLFEQYIYCSGEYMDDIRKRVAKMVWQMFPEERDKGLCSMECCSGF